MKLIWICLCLLMWRQASAQELNGFDLSESLIATDQIFRGGPPKDGIPSIDSPIFEPVDKYDDQGDKSEVLGVYYQGLAKAYPINIMDYHEVVNDRFKGQPVVVTYCPLCGSGITFKAEIDGKSTQFGVSGLLYNSDVLLYDRNTESLWSQIMAQAVTGPLKGKQLTAIPTQRMTLGSWKKLHPSTLILTRNTGYTRNYHQSPYGNYNEEDRTYFPLSHEDNRLHKKAWVIGVEIEGTSKAYPIDKLIRLKGNQLQDQLAGTRFTIRWDHHGENIRIKTDQGKEMVGLQMFWFAWVAFHPTTLIMTKGRRD